MSSIGSNSEDLVLNADGGSSTIKFKIDGTEKASISSAGAFTSTTIDATKLTGALPAISGANLTGLSSFDPDGAVTINDTGADVDFRVESDDNANMLFVDGGNDRVGIGTNSPTTILDIKKTAGEDAAGAMRVLDTNGGTIATDMGGQINFSYQYDSSGSLLGNSPYIKAIKTNNTSGNYSGGLAFGTRVHGSAQAERLRITDDGRGLSLFTAKAWVRWRTNQTNPAIRASHNVSSLTDNGVGDTNINFTNNLADAHYAISVSGITQYSHNGMNYNVTGTTTSTYQVIYHENTVARDGEFRSIVFGN